MHVRDILLANPWTLRHLANYPVNHSLAGYRAARTHARSVWPHLSKYGRLVQYIFHNMPLIPPNPEAEAIFIAYVREAWRPR